MTNFISYSAYSTSNINYNTCLRISEWSVRDISIWGFPLIFKRCYFLERKPQTSHVKYFVCFCVLCTIIYLVIYIKLYFCFSWRASEYSRDSLHNILLWWARLSIGPHWILNIGILRQSLQANGEIFQDYCFSYSTQFFTVILPYHSIVSWRLPVLQRKLLHLQCNLQHYCYVP
jgi:hypothetical protein